MKRAFFLSLMFAFVFSCVFVALAAETIEKTAYIFPYFIKNGKSGLYYAWSEDGLNWKSLKNDTAFFKPPESVGKLLRNPSIIQAPDGQFHMVWTCQREGKALGYASSKDLIGWTDIRQLPVMENEPGTKNCWAPELFYDDQDGIFTLLWSSTVSDKFPETAESSERGNNHRLYYATTKDFQAWSETQLFWEPGHNVLGVFLIKNEGRYYLFYKDETLKPEIKKHILAATSDSLTGPFEVQGVLSHVDWTQSPAVLRVNDDWLLYYDCYTKNHLGVLRSKNLKTWENVTDKITMPTHASPGAPFPVSSDILQGLLDAKP